MNIEGLDEFTFPPFNKFVDDQESTDFDPSCIGKWKVIPYHVVFAIRIWIFSDREHEVNTVNKLICTGGENGSVTLVNLHSRRVVYRVQLDSAVNVVKFYGCSHMLVGCENGEIVGFNLSQMEGEPFRWHDSNRSGHLHIFFWFSLEGNWKPLLGEDTVLFLCPPSPPLGIKPNQRRRKKYYQWPTDHTWTQSIKQSDSIHLTPTWTRRLRGWPRWWFLRLLPHLSTLKLQGRALRCRYRPNYSHSQRLRVYLHFGQRREHPEIRHQTPQYLIQEIR